MGKSPAQRAKESRRAVRIAAQREEQQRRDRKRRLAGLAMVVGVGAMTLTGVAAGLLGGGSGNSPHDPETTTLPTVLPPVELVLPEPGEAITGDTPCPAADGSSPRVTRFESAPPMCIDDATDTTYKAIVETAEGTLTILLLQEHAPQAVNSFVVLSRYHFYDGLPFFDILPNGYLRVGDPTGQPNLGDGGPGYAVPPERNPAGNLYIPTDVWLWGEGPGALGSQFVMVTGERALALSDQHVRLGLITEGFEALRPIEFTGNPGGGVPGAQTDILSIEIVEEPAPEPAAVPPSTEAPATTGAG